VHSKNIKQSFKHPPTNHQQSMNKNGQEAHPNATFKISGANITKFKNIWILDSNFVPGWGWCPAADAVLSQTRLSRALVTNILQLGSRDENHCHR